MEREELLKTLIKQKYNSVLQFSKESGIPESSIRNIFYRGLDSVNAGTLVTICKLLGVEAESLMNGTLKVSPNQQKDQVWSDYCNTAANILPMPRFVRKPRLGTIACGRPILAVEDVDEFDDVPEGVDCDFTLKCKGDSMINARIFDGDIVYVKEQPEVENGQIAAVIIDDEATLKKVYYTPGSDRITLRACNPLYADMVYEGETLNQIRILGRAVAFTSTIRDM